MDVLTNSDVHWPLTIKGNPHLLIAGLPGMGKTTCLLSLCRQMVTAGVHPIIFSYHQDIDERLSDLVASVRFVDFDGLGFNPLAVMNPESTRAYLDVAGSLRDIFAAIFPELGDLQCESIRGAIKESFTEAGWNPSEAGGAGTGVRSLRRDSARTVQAGPRAAHVAGASRRARRLRFSLQSGRRVRVSGRATGRRWSASIRPRTTPCSGRSPRWCSTACTRTCSAAASRIGSRTP